MSDVVVDTSVWIDFFRGRPTERLDEALRLGSVVVSPVVAAELVSGVRRAKDRRAIVELLQALPWHSTPAEHWLAVGDLRATLQRRGLIISTPDAHIAQCALDRDAEMLSRDAVFVRIARLCPLRLIRE